MNTENPQATNEINFTSKEYVSKTENRESLKREFQRAIETTLSEFSDQTGDSDVVFEKIEIPYQLNPPVVLAVATVTSKKIQYFCIDWVPSEKSLIRTMIMIRDEYQGQGMGTAMNSVTEAIAKKLGCKSVTVQAIVDTSIDYWKKKPDYKFNEANRSATKYF